MSFNQHRILYFLCGITQWSLWTNYFDVFNLSLYINLEKLSTDNL